MHQVLTPSYQCRELLTWRACKQTHVYPACMPQVLTPSYQCRELLSWRACKQTHVYPACMPQVLTPSYHAENYSPDDNRFDHRQFLYNFRYEPPYCMHLPSATWLAAFDFKLQVLSCLYQCLSSLCLDLAYSWFTLAVVKLRCLFLSLKSEECVHCRGEGCEHQVLAIQSTTH